MVIELFQGLVILKFAQITSDLKLAIETLPATPFTSTQLLGMGMRTNGLLYISMSICFILVT
jgi:hypothetical protein